MWRERLEILKIYLVGCLSISKSLSFSVGGNDACGGAKLHWLFWLCYPVHAGQGQWWEINPCQWQWQCYQWCCLAYGDVWQMVWWLFAGVPGKIMNNYCWIMSTYTLPRLWDVSSHHLHPDHQTYQYTSLRTQLCQRVSDPMGSRQPLFAILCLWMEMLLWILVFFFTIVVGLIPLHYHCDICRVKPIQTSFILELAQLKMVRRKPRMC